MNDTLPRQRNLPLTLDERTPLVPMQTAKIALGISEDDVLSLIEDGSLRFAFDARTPGSAHAMPLIWRECVVAKQGGLPQPQGELEGVIGEILGTPLPGPLPAGRGEGISVRAVRVRAVLGASSQLHVTRLIRAGVLKVDAGRPVTLGRAQSPWITWTSLAEFLRARRMV